MEGAMGTDDRLPSQLESPVSRPNELNFRDASVPEPSDSDELETRAPMYPHSDRNRRFVSEVVYLLFTTSFIYLVAGPWVGWSGSSSQKVVVTVCAVIAIVRWGMKKSLLRLDPHRKARNWQIQVYCLIPWRLLSRSWGKLAALPIPKMMRPLVYGVYSKLFGVNTLEMEFPLHQYSSICNFFTRRLNENARFIDSCGLLVSPCDGTVVSCGPVSDKYVNMVKGVDYSMETFLGLRPSLENIAWLIKDKNKPLSCRTRLYQCVLYLAPGDYHRFHSPCKWLALQRLHFSGQLLSVVPSIARWLPNLFTLNERVAYSGTWEYGFFSYTAVGATNVGSITVHNDPTLKTNKSKLKSCVDYLQFPSKFELERGEEMGLFSMGSTIVLIFEAPENFHFMCRENDRIKLGSCLGGLDFLSATSSPSIDDLSDIDWNDDIFVDYRFFGSDVLVS